MLHATLAPPPVNDREFCKEMLPKVSRTFALCIRLLPPTLEHSVLVAYLLCRIADTLEDTTSLVPVEKRELLEHFRSCLDPGGPGTKPLETAFGCSNADDEFLAHHAAIVLREFGRLPDVQQAAIRPWVQEMCSGMADFVELTDVNGNGSTDATFTVEDLDRYCYYVAGTVGHLLTELFRLFRPTVQSERWDKLSSLATSFGLGLQLTNIIKDVADDRRRGRSFLPRRLFDGDRPQIMKALIEKAKGHLCDALEYSTSLPRRYYRVRLFCLTSFYFAVRTIKLAEQDPQLLNPSHKVKITRTDVYRTVAVTRAIAPVNALVRTYFRRLAGDTWWRRYIARSDPKL